MSFTPNYLKNFHYQILGAEDSPRKLVFLHGLMGFGVNWMRITPAFKTTHQILIYDQRGHGRSFQPQSGYSPRDYAEDLRKILDELDWPKIELVGHSMGGRNALEFTHTYPQRVEKLVVEDIGPSMNQYGSSFVSGLLDFIPIPFENREIAKRFFEVDFVEKYADLENPNGLAQFLSANLQEGPDKRLIWKFYLPGIRESLVQGRAEERWHEIEALRVPTLWIRGEKSKDLKLEIFNEILRRNPLIKGVEIKNAGHWIHSDQPQDFIATLLGFLG